MNKITVPIYYCKSRIPLVVFFLKDKPFVAILDTGSEQTMVDCRMKDEGMSTSKTDIETKFIGVGGKSAATSVENVSDVITFSSKESEKRQVRLRGMLFDLSEISEAFRRKSGKDVRISAIIGADFLKAKGASIDFGSRTITFNYENNQQ